MGQVIPLVRRQREVEKALRVLLHKARTGELQGLAFVVVRSNGYHCAGRINIEREGLAIAAVGSLIDAIRREGDYFEPIEPPQT